MLFVDSMDKIVSVLIVYFLILVVIMYCVVMGLRGNFVIFFLMLLSFLLLFKVFSEYNNLSDCNNVFLGGGLMKGNDKMLLICIVCEINK